MLIIAEKINIMSKTIGPATRNREKGPIHELAIAQVKGGARCLDLNLGPATKDGPGMMQWLVQTVEEVVDDTIQLSLDTKNLEAMEAGLAVVKKHKPMINSTNADEGDEQLVGRVQLSNGDKPLDVRCGPIPRGTVMGGSVATCR